MKSSKLVQSNDNVSLLQVLGYLCSGNIVSIPEFTSQYKGLLETHHISTAVLVHTIHLLHLCNVIGSQCVVQGRITTVSYDSIMKSNTSVDLTDIEYWLVEAIANNLIEARLNQHERTVTIR